MKTTHTLWFNKGLSAVAQAIRYIRVHSDLDIQVLCSHTRRTFVGFEVADAHFIEPGGLTGREYLEYCLHTCDIYGVTIFWPSKEQTYLAQHRQQFEDRGIVLICPADAERLALFEDKDRFYRDAGLVCPVPTHRVVNSGSDFWHHYQDLKSQFDELCIKPIKGINGIGFRRIGTIDNALLHILKGQEQEVVDFNELAAAIASLPDEKFPPFLLMQYLAGTEYSCDCVAVQGELTHAVIREKSPTPGAGQLIIDYPEVQEIIQRLAQRYALNGPFNIQFRSDGTTPHVLEINPRLSGGIHLSCASGIHLPIVALQSALGEPIERYTPRLPLRVFDYASGLPWIVGYA